MYWCIGNIQYYISTFFFNVSSKVQFNKQKTYDFLWEERNKQEPATWLTENKISVRFS